MEKADDRGKGTIVLAHGQGRRPRHRQEPRRHHPVQQRLRRSSTSASSSRLRRSSRRPRSTTPTSIGMSGLLVKCTVIMRENLEELNPRGIAARWPVLLGGAALTRAYVEQDLAELFEGEVRYARDAFEGLRLMDAVMAVKRGRAAAPRCRAAQAAGDAGHGQPLDRRRTGPDARRAPTSPPTTPVPDAAVLGRRAWSRASPLADFAAYLDERATVPGPVGPEAGRGGRRAVVRGAGRDRGPAAAADVAGPDPDRGPARGGRRLRLLPVRTARATTSSCSTTRRAASRSGPGSPSRASAATGSCAWPTSSGRSDSGETDVVAFQLVTMGSAGQRGDRGAVRQANAYRDYLELHGLSVQLTEALAEYWHARVRERAGLRRRGRRRRWTPILQAGLPRLALLVRLPRLPRPRGPGQARRPARARRGSASSCPRSSSSTPSSPPPRMIVHHPEAKYFNAT